MSGETVVLGGGGGTAALVRALARLAATDVRFAVVGGLAVACRLAAVHRATEDVDLVADQGDGDTPTTVVLAREGAGHRPRGGGADELVVEGATVQVIDTTALDDAAAIEDEGDRLFVVAHRYALDTATTCRIAVTGGGPDATVPVATAPALLATKLHAFHTRRAALARKKASDAYDVFRLLADVGPAALAHDLAQAGLGLAGLVDDALHRAFVEDADRTARRLATDGDPAWGHVAAADLTRLASLYRSRPAT